MSEATVRFSADEAQRAWSDWGANCGPGAIAAIAGLTLEELRPHLGDFERKKYTNPPLMWQVLTRLGLAWRLVKPPQSWPTYGLARVQWEGPWTAPGVPMRVRYRHTHWVGARDNHSDGPVRFEPPYATEIFDINCICVGGWVPVSEWAGQVVPWLLRQIEPKADGRWHLTHVVEVGRSAGDPGRTGA